MFRLEGLVGSAEVGPVVDAVFETISARFGERRAKHFRYHATRKTKTFSRSCVAMAASPIECMASPKECMKARNISATKETDLKPETVWAHTIANV